ncbi:tetratricopeptide repeat protein [Pseudoalteromonas sp. T1lg23B]|uniref:tetratricopeptide repeat protein n=1 Tax=Pseudoalteromonas sp. T1lg23B TaxID=2077097 RepID=UPI00131A2558|nr:tetratricopeptide repeat protein [Pseudoalteromonas sp. T1lg23B]
MFKSFLCFIALAVTFFCPLSSAKNKDYEYQLTRAQYFSRSDPKQALNILGSIKDVAKLSDEQKITFYILNMRLSLILNKLDEVEPHIQQLFLYDGKPEFVDQLVSILSGAGIWLRKQDYLDAAQHTFSCALKHASKSSQRIALLISSAIVARYQQQYDVAKALYAEAAQIAKRRDDQRGLATVENNLGAIELDQENFAKANEHFRNALAGFQMAQNHSGHINSGINLLLTFVLQEQLVNYQRLYSHIAQLSEEYPDDSKKAYLLWVNTAYYHRQGVNPDAATREKLAEAFDQLAGPQLQRLINKHLAALMGVDVVLTPPGEAKVITNSQWFEKIARCNW